MVDKHFEQICVLYSLARTIQRKMTVDDDAMLSDTHTHTDEEQMSVGDVCMQQQAE